MLRKLLLTSVILTALPCAALAAEKLSVSGATLTLNEEFKTRPEFRKGGTQVNDALKPLSDPSFSWASGYIWNHAVVGTVKSWPPAKDYFPAWTSNGTADANPNWDMILKMGRSLGPFDWSSGSGLIIKAKELPAYLGRTVPYATMPEYMSGTLTSFPYAQKYGVFEMRARVPKGKGLWPAFWLLPSSKDWPPEIDIMEVLGRSTNVVVNTMHVKGTDGKHYQNGKATTLDFDLSADYHNYAVDWGPTHIKWYLDGVLLHTEPTPNQLKVPCYIIANLAVGKPTSWGGAPDASTKFPAEYKIKHIKVWQRPDYK